MYNPLSAEQVRQFTDAVQVFGTYREAEQDLRHRFAGSMSWKSRNDKGYLYRIIKGREQSLGPETAETREIYQAFRAGRTAAIGRFKALQERLNEMAPVNQAMRLGRVPLDCARILRMLDAEGYMGGEVIVVGTNALYNYEALAGVQFGGGVVATGDVDLLLDSRQKLRLAADNLNRKGLLGLLARVDKSYKPVRGRRYSAANDRGFLVDLIAPQGRNPLTKSGRLYLGSSVDDLEAAEIEGLIWLLNVPKCESVCIGEDGYPLRLSCPDPRAFAAHKLWIAQRQDREPLKKSRDRQQAELLLQLLKERLVNYPLDAEALSAFPREVAGLLVKAASKKSEGR
jgi:hypothetical protein